MKKFILLLILFLVAKFSFSQNSYNDFRSYYLQGYDGTIDENESSDLNQILRMDYFMRPRTKDYTDLSEVEDRWKTYLNSSNQNVSQNRVLSANWSPLGPFKIPPGLPISIYAAGNGLFTTLVLDPVDPDKIFITSAHGGLWSTVDGGSTWVNLSDFSLPIIRISDIAIDPTDNNIMYVATGDRDDYHHKTLCAGIYRSMDGGISWNSVNTGLSTLISFSEISKILIDPSNTNTIFISTSKGIFKTLDAKTTCTWTSISDVLVLNKYFRNILFKPDGLSTTLLAAGKNIIKSTDGGLTWSALTGALTSLDFSTFSSTPFPSRINIACTPSNPEVIYASVILTDSPLEPEWQTTRVHHLFKFDGSTWVEKNGIPNSIDFTESWMAIDVSPIDENIISLASTVGWKSTDGGSTSLSQMYFYSGGVVHPDVHDIKFSNDGISIFFATDGGVFKNTAGVWTPISNGIAANTVTKIGLSASDPDYMFMGAFHSGSNKYDPLNLPLNEPWNVVNGGDGSETIIDYTNPSIVFVSSQNNSISRSTNRATSNPSGIGRPTDPACGSATTLEKSMDIGNYSIDPKNPNKIYVGYTDLHSYNSITNTWKKLTDLPADFGLPPCSETVYAIGISETDPLTMYISTEVSNQLFKTTTGGYDNGCLNNCWSELFPPNPHTITGIAVSFYDPNKIWICYSGYDVNEKVKYFDGTTWFNYSDGIPNLPINNIIYEHGSNDGLYIATDLGVYYRNHTMSQWEPFMDNLPNVQVSELEINYFDNSITAGTYGRGMWKSHLNCPVNYDLTAVGSDPNYEAEHNLTAMNSFSPNNILKFRAGNAIDLNPGFEVSINSSKEFSAFIHPCNHDGNSFNLRLSSHYREDHFVDKNDASKLLIYPNPSYGEADIEFNLSESLDGQIIIYNIYGEVVKQEKQNFNEGKNVYHVKDMGSGLFYISIITKESMRTGTVILKP